MTGETRTGAACQRVRIPLTNLIRTPDGVTDEQAASLPTAYGTAHRMMYDRGNIQPKERVLVLGATGGVGVGCVQLGARIGAEMIGVGSASWKLDKLLALGASTVIDSSKEEDTCSVEPDWVCSGLPSVCTTVAAVPALDYGNMVILIALVALVGSSLLIGAVNETRV
ncbi:MAG: hypothetical protein VCB42_12050 [Myxococcota bacterium]